MDPVANTGSISTADIITAVRGVWGFDSLRPLQEEAIRAALDGRDSLVVMPTGGGKSLCYQVPPLLDRRTDVVVSPLISLMKDQVDGLKAAGYPAESLHSGLTPAERNAASRAIREGDCRLIFVSPERLLTGGFLDVLHHVHVRSFAIDEAHCISHWGHDFRPEYRKLATLKQRFPNAAVHAYTATATQRVRDDIAAQLNLDDAQVLVGNFDRPNLTYRVVPRLDLFAQTVEIIGRHRDEAVIVYCMTRRDTEDMAEALRAQGIDARHYHAGMDARERRDTQEAFADESVNVIAATIAFGMGIDRSNVRCIIHATLPKSIEHYQQETGRAGRDGLEAECVLLYSAADVQRWESLLTRSTEDAEEPEEVLANHLALLREMQRFATVPKCRHQRLVEYFGQRLPGENCQACDVCLDEIEGAEDMTVTAQKILSCVARLRENYGVGYTVQVLRGADVDLIRRRRHDELSTYGLLDGVPDKTLTNFIYQLVDQGILDRTVGDRPILRLNKESWDVMRGKRNVLMYRPRTRAIKRSKSDLESWEGVDEGLFEHLRLIRRDLASKHSVPAYVIFSDATLRDMARLQPNDEPSMLAVHGIGKTKYKKFGKMFLGAIADYASGSAQ